MKRTTKQTRVLPAFRMSLAELEALVGRLLALFGDQKASWHVDVKLRNEELKFESFDEIRACRELPDAVTTFSLWMSANGRRLWVRSGGPLGSDPTVDAEGDDPAWCAGAVAVTRQYLNPFRRWYSWFRGWPIGAGVLLLLNVPTTLRLTPLKPMVETAAFLTSWLALFLVFIALYFARGRLLPAGTVQVRQVESTLRRYLPEITLAVSVIALLLTIIGWFYK